MDLFWKVVNMVCSTSWAPARWWQSFFYKFLYFTGSQDNWGWNGSQEVIQSNFLLKCQLRGQIRLLGALSSCTLETYREGDWITSPDSLLHCLTVLMVKKKNPYFLTFNLNLSYLNCFLFSPQQLASPSVSLWLDAGRLQSGPHKHITSPVPVPQLILTGQILQCPDYLGGPLLNSLQFINLSWIWGPKQDKC